MSGAFPAIVKHLSINLDNKLRLFLRMIRTYNLSLFKLIKLPTNIFDLLIAFVNKKIHDIFLIMDILFIVYLIK